MLRHGSVSLLTDSPRWPSHHSLDRRRRAAGPWLRRVLWWLQTCPHPAHHLLLSLGALYLVWGQESSLCKLTSKSLQNGRSWHLCFLPGTFLNVVGTEHRLLELKEETLRDEMVMNWGFLLYPSQPLAQRPGQSEDNASLSNSLRRQALHPLALSRRHERESSHLARRVSGAEDMATPGKGKWDGAGVPPHPDNRGSAPHPPLSQWCSSTDPLYDYAILPTDIKWTLVVTTDKNWNQSKSNLGKLMVLF